MGNFVLSQLTSNSSIVLSEASRHLRQIGPSPIYIVYLSLAALPPPCPWLHLNADVWKHIAVHQQEITEAPGALSFLTALPDFLMV